jgi:hypothetical protein
VSRQDGLSLWMRNVSSHMPHLSKPQATVLALWSYGIAIMRTCGRCTVAQFVSQLLEQPDATVEQRLREWCYDAPDKRGKRRRELDVSTCFVPLLQWIVRLWTTTRIALALDATQLSDRFVVLTVSVVYRGCAIPVAWHICRTHQKGSWRPLWLRLIRQLQPAIPADWTVLVLSDRGLYARWLFRRIVRLGWHPFMRVNRGAKFQPAGQGQWIWLSELVGQVGQRWCGRGVAFKDAHTGQLTCTLLAWWGEGHAEPWFILTDLAPQACQVDWYGLRAWCEQGFKCLKRGGWQWQSTRMTNPARTARLWLAMAVAMLWVVSIGGDCEITASAELPHLSRPRQPDKPAQPAQPRRTRIFRQGVIRLLVLSITGHVLPLPRRLVPEPWPVPGISAQIVQHHVIPSVQTQKTYP